MVLILLILTSCACIVATEILKRTFSLPTALTRRVIHVTTAMVAVVAPLYVSQKEIIVVSILFAAALIAGRRYNIFSAIHSVERDTFGEVFLPLGVALTALFFLPHDISAFQFGICIMGISDVVAGLIGEQFGKHRATFFGNTKSLEGSLTFFLSTLLLTFLFVPVFGYDLLLTPLLLTLVEFCLVYGLDNLILPLAGAFLLQNIFH